MRCAAIGLAISLAAACSREASSPPSTLAVAVRRPDGGIDVHLGDHPHTCDEAYVGGFLSSPGEHLVSFALQRELARDGSRAWELVAYDDGKAPHEEGLLAPAVVVGDPGADRVIDVRVSYKALAGTIPVRICGDAQLPRMLHPVPRAAHASTAVITVAGQRFPLAAAIVEGGRTILSIAPAVCGAGAPSGVVLVHEDADDTWRLGGSWLPRDLAAAPASLTSSLGSRGQSADGPTVQLALAGEASLGGYRVALTGTIEALDCPR